MSGGSTDTVDVPLYLVDADGFYKIGIEVSLDCGQTFQMYEFDTGGKGFWVAQDAAWGSINDTGHTASNSYSSGLSYTAEKVTGSVSLRGSDGTTISTSGTIAQIQEATGQDWNTANAADGGPPLYSAFYGDFGASLADKDGLETFLKQFGTTLSDGFIVTLNSLSSIDHIVSGGTYAIGTLQLGLTTDQIAGYEAYGTIAMEGQKTDHSDIYDYSEQLVTGTLSVNHGETTVTTGVVLDTGAPDSFIQSGSSFTIATPVHDVTLSAGSTTLLDFRLGTDRSQNVLGYPDNGAGSYINSGLTAFLGQSVMFDVTGGFVALEPACFARGTRLRRPHGDSAVEALTVGDCLVTAEGEVLPILWIGQRAVDCTRHPAPEKVWPVCIAAEAFGPGLPGADLFLSPDHAIFAEGVLIPVKHLINGHSVRQVPCPEVTYFHVELARHTVVLAEGLPAETYLDTGDRRNFDSGEGALALHPVWGAEARDIAMMMEALGAAPLRVTGPEVARVRQALAARSCPDLPEKRSLRA